MSESPKVLWPASRQYKNSKGAFIPAFEYDETIKIVCALLTKNEKLRQAIRNTLDTGMDRYIREAIDD